MIETLLKVEIMIPIIIISLLIAHIIDIDEKYKIVTLFKKFLMLMIPVAILGQGILRWIVWKISTIFNFENILSGISMLFQNNFSMSFREPDVPELGFFVGIVGALFVRYLIKKSKGNKGDYLS
ncbi:hypothetical protein [Methanococcus maripaludis]|uniref:Energy-converting hydrogenase Eha subunit A n=1 Tax=Methanococcus maripaludis TaxID=39152 RepID=A0A7J9PE91_METMI|nr:hypothetical protein [Methanococcus maripaludis]MBA2861056.1 energy-converting hydrogenase Eha subunit A [Methanococcus maripaludis]